MHKRRGKAFVPHKRAKVNIPTSASSIARQVDARGGAPTIKRPQQSGKSGGRWGSDVPWGMALLQHVGQQMVPLTRGKAFIEGLASVAVGLADQRFTLASLLR
jgi:hypothetical protein